MVAVVVFWDMALQVGGVILGRLSENGRTLSHYTGEIMYSHC